MQKPNTASNDAFSKNVAEAAVKLNEILTPIKPIPISAAEEIAKKYGYHQVVVIARRVGENPMPCGEHVTTYGVNKKHCAAAAQIGNFLKFKIMKWSKPDGTANAE